MLNSLKYKISITIFILVSTMLIILIWQTLSSVYQQNKLSIESIKNTSLTPLQNTARAALFSEEYDSIQFRIEQLVQDPHILEIFLADNRNIIVASNQFKRLGTPAPQQPDTDTENSRWEIINIKNLSNNLGTLYVHYTFADINKSYQEILTQTLYIALAGALMIAVISLFLGHLLTHRLNILSQAAENISRGRLNSRSRLTGNDEISKLGQTFDNMADYIEREQERLEAMNQELEQRVKERTLDYENTNRELEAFCYSVSHDLRAPLRSIEGFSLALAEDCTHILDDTAKQYISRLQRNSRHMSELIENLLKLSRINQQTLNYSSLNLSEICNNIIERLKEQQPDRNITFKIDENIQACGDKALITIALENLLSNAWKYTSQLKEQAIIEFSCETTDGQKTYFIKDNGAGFDMRYVDQLFRAFQRLHNNTEFEGTGIGLSIVQRIIHRHGGQIWARSGLHQGSCFYFTLSEQPCNDASPQL